MFTGLTNQVNSWMGAVKGDEEVPPPSGEGVDASQQQVEVAVDQAQAAFENINVNDAGDENGGKATR